MKDAHGARVLLVNELGLGRWHVELLAAIARRLAVEGDVACWFALPDPVAAADVLQGARVLAAPHHMPGPARRRAGPTRSFADILADAGWDETATLRTLLGSWRTLYDLIAPDLIVADHAPTATLAARGRVPVVVVGLGFGQPPADPDTGGTTLPRFSRTEDARQLEAPVLAVLREALGADAPPTLPAALASTCAFVTCLDALDPWRELRAAPALGPVEAVPARLGPVAPGEIVAYLSADDPRTPDLLAGLARSGRRTVAWVRDASPTTRATLAAIGGERVRLADRPLALAAALERACVVVHHGGAGTIHQAVAAGRPQLVVPRYLEQVLNAHALVRRGVAAIVDDPSPAAVAAALAHVEHARAIATADAWAVVTAAELEPDAAGVVARAALAAAV